MDFIERLKKNAEQYPDRVAVVDRDGARSTTYRDLFNCAMRVNRYLQDRGIGKEDTVGIYYPKGMEYIATRIGVMMAGAAWVALEDLMGKERIDYVIKDCGCALVMREAEWEEAMKLPECPEFIEPDPHDLAFYIYTSGSSGAPKGAAEEYGVYDLMWEGLGKGFLYEHVYPDGEGEGKRKEILRFGHVIPESFVGGVYITVGVLGFGCTIHAISWEITMDPVRLSSYLNEHRIDSTFMTPTFLKVLQQLGIKSMRVCYTGGEIVSGIAGGDFDVINIYGSSEFAYAACHFKIDRAYSNTPIGYPTKNSEIVLIDEDRNEADEGELCVYLPFFRGYHDLQKENERAFVTIRGKRFFKSADYASLDKEGRYTVWGRIGEMVKINGNRVELSEVENAVNKAFGTEFCAVKAFKGDNGTSYLCAYYKGDIELSPGKSFKLLSSYIPEYMIPQCFVRITEIPLNANGKVDKLRLPEPSAVGTHGTYAEPENDVQRAICEAFETVLQCNRKVGINDDFFDLGGDSIKVMLVILKCRLKGLNAQDIYEGRTAKEIETLIRKQERSDIPVPAKEVPYVHVNATQNYLICVQKENPDSSVLNLAERFLLDTSVDLNKLAEAIEKAMLLHPSITSTIEETESGFLQRFDKCVMSKIVPEKMNNEELEIAAAEFVKPFRFDNTPLFRCRLIETPDSKVCLIDVCHAICAGGSYHLLLEDIGRIYRNEPVVKDEYLEICVDEELFRESDAFGKEMDYFRERYDRTDCVTYPTPDHNDRENVDDKFFLKFPFKREEVQRISDMYELGRNGLYIAAAAIALSLDSENGNVAFTWNWNGRNDLRKMDSVGCFLLDLPVTFTLEEDLSIESFLNEVAAQVRDGIAHGHVSYWEECGGYYGNDLLCMIFQGDIYDFKENDEIVKEISELVSPNTACDNKMDLEILDSENAFGVLVDYDAGVYERTTAEAFAKLFCKVCSELVRLKDHSLSIKSVGVHYL